MHGKFCTYTAFMNLHPPRIWLPPEPPDQVQRDAFEDEARAMREEYAAARPARLAVLATGPPLRDIDKAADCSCSCHPSPASSSLHEGGAECPCQLTAAERAERWDRLFEHLGETAEASEEAERERAELAVAAAELDVDAELRCPAFPFVVAGICDGRSFFLREKRGHWRVEVAADPDCADLWGTRGALGIEIADIAVGRVPGSHRLHLQRGVALAMKGRFEDAEGAFDRATALAPEASLPGTALGLILMQQDRLPEAVTVLRKRSKRAAGDYMVHWFLAEALHRSGVEPGSEAEAEAVRAVRRSVALNPELFQSRLLLGRMLARRGVFNEAIEHLQKARAIDPTAVAATYQLALVHRSLGDTEQAKELLALVGRQKAEDREQFTKGGLLRIVREGRP